VIGAEVAAPEQASILRRLGCEVEESSVPWTVTVPSWRARDVTREIDLVEEIARVHGLEKVPFTLPLRREMFGRLTQEQRLRRLVEEVLVGCGFAEAYTWSLAASDHDPEAIRLPEPLSAEHAILRTSLVEGLVAAARHNLDAANDRIALFEVARVYLPSGGRLPDERWRVGGIANGDEPFAGYYRAKGAVQALHDALKITPLFEREPRPWLHPGAAASVSAQIGGTATPAGWLGELHPTLLSGSWGVFELDLATLFAEVPERVLYEDVVTFPAVRQDLAFVVAEEVLAGELVQAARDAAGHELREASVFDVYRGGQLPPGRKSIAIRVAFQSSERTLSDDDARVLRERIVEVLAERFGAELRA
jgi:phenylalanyl-tRNA synthetase beta chain